MIYVQHLLGVGHLQRSIQLAAELAQHDFDVTLVSGGRQPSRDMPAGVVLRQLPPVYSPDGSFTRLLDAHGNEIDDSWRDRRKWQLLDIFDSCAPQALITETFPFGRRMMRFELLPLLEAARASSSCLLVIASIRDILQPRSKPGRNLEVCELLDKYYDHVLVHGDQKIAQLADSFALAERIAQKIFYSGYICTHNTNSPPGNDGIDEVIVSAGGSSTGLEILKTSIAAKPLSSLRHLQWRLLASPTIDEFDYGELQRLADEGTSVERNRPDFSELVKRARLSISQAGYNTITDILNSTTAAVVVPFAEAGEIEQTMRAQILQHHGRLVMLEQENLSAPNLAAAIDRACKRNARLEVNLAGAQHSAAAVSHWLAAAGSAS